MPALFRISGFLPYIAVIFLNAFVDLGHKIIIQNTVFKTLDGQEQIALTAVVNALILLPFILLFTPSGFLSDKYPKNWVMRISAWVAVGITCLITLFYYLGWFWPAFAMTFILAVQSALYSPAKYGFIKELVGKDLLTQANGFAQAMTTAAILFGMFAFSILFEHRLVGHATDNSTDILRTIAPVGWLLVLGSLVELVLAYRLPKVRDTNHALHFDRQQYLHGQYLSQNLKMVYNNRVIWLSIVGLSVFWSISQVMLAAFPAFAKQSMDVTNTVMIQGMMMFAGIGIMTGSIFAGRISKNHIETGLIPVGALGIAVCLAILPGLQHIYLHGLNFFVLGICAGMFIVPLNALIQFHADENDLGTVLAGNNFIQNIVMLSFLGVTIVFAVLGITSTALFGLLTLVAIGGAVYTVYKLPQILTRFIVARLFAVKYRLKVIGFHNIPGSGGVLMLGNHISWIDWAIVQIACPRPVRFVMERSIYERWYLKWIMKFFGVIPIASGASKTALATVNRLLNEGEVVCLFPEGVISRTGQLAEFKRGYEKAAEGANAVILPFYLRGLWGSRFSRSSDKLKADRDSGDDRRDVIIAFGEPLDIATHAAELKQKVFELSIHSWEEYTRSLPTLPIAFLETATRKRKQMAIADTSGKPMTYAQLSAAVLLFSRLINQYSKEQTVGLLLPTTSAGTIANMACLMRGKTVVNLNYTASESSVAAAISKAGIKTVYSSRKFMKKLASKGIDLEGAFSQVTVHYMEDMKDKISKAQQITTYLQTRFLPASMLASLYCKRVDSESAAAILFSSGSEGVPKGVMLSHRNFMANLKQISDVLNTENEDIIMATLPLFHAFGLTVTTFMPLVEGIPMICHPDPTDVLKISKAIAQYRATILCGTSTFLRLYVKNRRVHPLMLESIRIIVAGAEKLNQDVYESFKLKFNKTIYEGYGATETTPVASVNIPDQLDTRYWRPQLGQKNGTVGLPLPGTGFRIVDPATLDELPAGEDGLILIGGTQVMLGYLDEPEKTKQAIVEIDALRWYKTGDKGHLDEDGFLSIVDRYSRFAKIGGEMISLSAVENAVRNTLNDPELDMAATSLPDDKKGEKIILLVNGELSAKDIKQQLIDGEMKTLSLPANIFIVDEIPKLGSGKTDFTALRKLAIALIEQR
ncbi:MAG: acyl-[ACP]--phospholipid O-acyltransferase [Gammaproteobacteria bacterium]